MGGNPAAGGNTHRGLLSSVGRGWRRGEPPHAGKRQPAGIAFRAGGAALEPITVRLRAAGDNLIHSSIYNQAKARAKDGGYDFGTPMRTSRGSSKTAILL